MKKRITFHLLLPFLLFFFPAISFSGNPVTPESPDFFCPAPQPQNVHATSVTPTSITLAWDDVSPTFTNYYKIEGIDLSTGLPIPTTFATNENTTVYGLKPNTCYSFTVSASFCAGGPFGKPSEPCQACTGYIIIDVLTEFQVPQGPGQPHQISATPFLVCMPRSTISSGTNYYDMPAVCQITYLGKELRFGMALKQENNNVPLDTMHIDNIPPDPGFQFVYRDSQQKSVRLLYNSTSVLDVRYYAVTQGALAYAFMEITLLDIEGLSNCMEWSFNCPVPPPLLVHNGAPKLLKAQGSDTNTDDPNTTPTIIASTPWPNPFSNTVSLPYTLKESGMVEIQLFDAIGTLIKTIQPSVIQEAGYYEASFSGAGLPNGVYFLHLRTSEQHQVFPLVKRE